MKLIEHGSENGKFLVLVCAVSVCIRFACLTMQHGASLTVLHGAVRVEIHFLTLLK